MKFTACSIVIALCAFSVCKSEHVTPVQKVIQLLESMADTGRKEQDAEQAAFGEYNAFCMGEMENSEKESLENAQNIEVATADMNQNKATAKRLTIEIRKHDDDISAWERDLKAAQDVRDMESEDFKEMSDDYEESIDALGRAMVVLKEEDVNHAQTTSLLQFRNAPLIPEKAKTVLAAFLQTREPAVAVADGYQAQSGGIIGMLEKLEDEFKDKLTEQQHKEQESVDAHRTLHEGLRSQTDHAKDAAESKGNQKLEENQAESENKMKIKDLTEEKNSADARHSKIKAKLATKKAEFQNRQKLRTEELEAIAKAIQIITEGALNHEAEHVRTSFAQLRSTRQDEVKTAVARYLVARADAIHSRVLSALAVRVTDDHFAKVRDMIRDLLKKLKEEAAAEAEHKGWCNEQLHANEATRKKKTNEVMQLVANKDELSAAIADLEDQLAKHHAQIDDINKAMAQASAIREDERKDNEATILDAKASQEAIKQALTVLKEFYEKAGQATSFVQSKEDPEIFKTEYKGMQAQNGGVVGMLEVIQSDFVRLESDTKAEEDQSKKDQKEFMTTSRKTKKEHEVSIETKTAKKQDTEQARQLNEEDLEGNKKALGDALDYFNKLKPPCIKADVNYEERVQQREEELESLQKALEILNGQAV